MALMTSLVALSIDGMLPALAAIGANLGAVSANQTQWVVTALLIGLAAGQLVYGPLSDSVGRKGPVQVGLVIFGVGCLLCIVASDFRTMLAGRLLQGLGVAGPRSVSIALIRDLHSGREMAKIMSLIMSVFILVPIMAPAVGQGILLVLNWRGIFGFFLLLSLVVSAWFALRQPETLPRERRKRFALEEARFDREWRGAQSGRNRLHSDFGDFVRRLHRLSQFGPANLPGRFTMLVRASPCTSEFWRPRSAWRRCSTDAWSCVWE